MMTLLQMNKWKHIIHTNEPWPCFLFAVEDPSEDFVRLRDFVDVKNALKQVTSLGSLEAVSSGFTEAMATEANQKLKLCKRQARRVYEILRLHFVHQAGGLSEKNQAYRDYRVDVKKRLNVPFQVRIFFFSLPWQN